MVRRVPRRRDPLPLQRRGAAARPTATRSGLCAGPQRLFHDGDAAALRARRRRLPGRPRDRRTRGRGPSPTRRRSPGTAGTAGTIFSNNFHVFCRVRGTVELDGATDDGRRARVARPLVGRAPLGQLRLEPELRGDTAGVTAPCSSASRRWSATNGSFFRFGRLGQARASRCRWPAPRCSSTSTTTPCAARRPRSATGSRTAGRPCVRIETIGGMIGATAQRYGWESVGDVTRRRGARRLGLPRDQHQPPQRAEPARLRAGRRADQRHRTRPDEMLSMRQPADDRRCTTASSAPRSRTRSCPELTSASAIDAAGARRPDPGRVHRRGGVGRALSAEFGAAFEALLGDAGRPCRHGDRHPGAVPRAARQAADVVAADAAATTRRRRSAAGGWWTSSAASSNGSTSCAATCSPKRRRRRRCETSSAECSVTAEQLTGYLRRKLPGSPELS